MVRLNLSCCVLSLTVASGSLAGCGGSQPPIGVLLGSRYGAVPTERAHPDAGGRLGTVFSMTKSGKAVVLYRFGGGSEDGSNPYAGLTNIGDTLYGTTESGGAYNGGTAFAIAPSGAETVLHSFGGSGDGANPLAGLVNVNGTLYGTTLRGGGNGCYNNSGNGCGTIFSITPSGTETVIYSFKGFPDGALPAAGLLNVNGTLYGTTRSGGNSSCSVGGIQGCGAVFEATPSGEETVLYSFDGNGAYPEAGLTNVNGTLYGTAYSSAGGIVFKISTSGKESIVYKFQEEASGWDPHSGLLNVNGTLYGTTREGGIPCNHTEIRYCGTVYSVTPSGSEKVLHSFAGSSDGKWPLAGLIKVNGTLYGTTSEGGVGDHGTVFAITTSGAEKVVHTFGRVSAGKNPYAGLLEVKGRLYGTTFAGGAH